MRATQCITAALAIASFTSSAAGASPQQLVRWQQFSAVSVPFGGDRREIAAILVPARLEQLGVSGWLQLDTGIVTTTLYEATLRRVMHAARALPAVLHVDVGGTRADVRPQAYANLDEGDVQGRPVLGSLGVDALRGRVLAIDFPHRRLAFAASTAQLPADARPRIAVPMRVVTTGGNNANLTVRVRLGNGIDIDAAYDTGSSPFVLIVSKAIWRRATGRALSDARNIELHVPAWGRPTTFVGAPVRGVLSVGTPVARDPIVYTGGDAATDARFANGTDGTLGNAAFMTSYAIVLDLVAGRFGLRKVGR